MEIWALPINWGDGNYEQFTTLILSTLKNEKSFSRLVKKILDSDVAEIKGSGLTGGLSPVARCRGQRRSPGKFLWEPT
jgi:hypothetical protein